MNKQQIYLDYAAATPIGVEAFYAMQPYFSENFYNPSATYMAARQVKQDINEARKSVAREIGAKPGEIIFTAGGTESANLAIDGIMSAYPAASLIYSSVEHDAVRQPARKFAALEAPVNEKGVLDVEHLKRLITDNTVLISVMYVNNEVATVQPIKLISELIKAVRQDRSRRGVNLPLYLHSDACQAAAYLDLNVERLGVDLMTINGGKIYGPKQSGFLYVRAGIYLNPVILGGGQERGLRSGTENVASIIGLASAFAIARKRAVSEKNRLEKLRQKLVADLEASFEDIVINGHRTHNSPHILSITFPGVDNERLMMLLDEKGIMVATGSACSASKQQASHVLSAMGVNDAMAYSTIRVSFGRDTDEKSLNRLMQALTSSVTEIKQLS